MNHVNPKMSDCVLRAWGYDRAGLLSDIAITAREHDVNLLAGVAHTYHDQACIFCQLSGEPESIKSLTDDLAAKFEPKGMTIETSPIRVLTGEGGLRSLPWRVSVTSAAEPEALERLAKLFADEHVSIISWQSHPYLPVWATRERACLHTLNVLLPLNHDPDRLKSALKKLRETCPLVLSYDMDPL